MRRAPLAQHQFCVLLSSSSAWCCPAVPEPLLGRPRQLATTCSLPAAVCCRSRPLVQLASPTNPRVRPHAAHHILTTPTLHIVRNLYFQHRPLSFTGSLGVGCESLLKVKVKDSVGLRPYSQLECSTAQLTESKGKGQCGPRRELRVKVTTSKTLRRPTRQPTTTTDSQPGPCHMRRN